MAGEDSGAVFERRVFRAWSHRRCGGGRSVLSVPLLRLNEAQCIYMAGLPNNPGRFGADPSGEAAMARYRHVIATMERNGNLPEQKAAALGGVQLF